MKKLIIIIATVIPFISYWYILTQITTVTPTSLPTQVMTIETAAGIPLSICDQRYALAMQEQLERLRPVMNQDTLKIAQDYMIMVKQYQDLDFKIRSLERTTFDVPTVAILRTPLARYSFCIDKMRTGTLY